MFPSFSFCSHSSTKAYMQFGLNTYHTKYDLVEALSRLEFYEGYTNTSGALRLMRQGVYVRSAGDRLSRQDIAIGKKDIDPSVNIGRSFFVVFFSLF